MNAEFNIWLLIVGLIVGAGLVWLVVMDARRQEADIDAAERLREAAWLSVVLAEDGFEVSPEAAERLLLLHRAYLAAPPPDEVEDEPPANADEPTDKPTDAEDATDAATQAGVEWHNAASPAKTEAPDATVGAQAD